VKTPSGVVSVPSVSMQSATFSHRQVVPLGLVSRCCYWDWAARLLAKEATTGSLAGALGCWVAAVCVHLEGGGHGFFPDMGLVQETTIMVILKTSVSPSCHKRYNKKRELQRK
jgi:hypothetical protein